VSLTAKNDAGEDTKTQNIDISGLATTGSHLFYTSVGDKGDISVYVNNAPRGESISTVAVGGRRAVSRGQ